MKNLVLAGFALLLVSACSDKSAKTSKKDQHEGVFVKEQTMEVPALSRAQGGRMDPALINLKVERLVVISVKDGKYHRYEVLKEGTKKPELIEEVYDYTINEDGSLERTLVADTCGEIPSGDKSTVKMSDSNWNDVSTGQPLERAETQKGADLVAEIEANKEAGKYSTDCLPGVRAIKNTVTETLKSAWETLTESVRQGGEKMSDPDSAIGRRIY